MTPQLLGEIVTLWARSPYHRVATIEDLGRLVVAPCLQGYAVTLRDDAGKLVAWATWALLSNRAEKGFVSGDRQLQIDDWTSGQRLWIIDVVAPHGHGPAIVRKLRERLRQLGYRGRRAKYRRRRGGERHYRSLIV